MANTVTVRAAAIALPDTGIGAGTASPVLATVISTDAATTRQPGPSWVLPRRVRQLERTRQGTPTRAGL
jgi:hypothetical protein